MMVVLSHGVLPGEMVVVVVVLVIVARMTNPVIACPLSPLMYVITYYKNVITLFKVE